MRIIIKNLKFSTLIISTVFILTLLTQFSFAQKNITIENKEQIQKLKKAKKNYSKATDYFSKQKFNKSEKELKKCIEIFSAHSNAYYHLSKISYKNGNFSRALEDINKAKTNYRTFIKINMLSKQQNLRELSESSKRMRGGSGGGGGGDRRQDVRLATTKIRHKMDKARTHLKNFSASTNIVLSDYYYFHGNILFKTKKLQKAHEQYLQAIKINPEHGNAYNNLAIIYQMAKQYKEALKCLNQAEAKGIKVNPNLKKAILDSQNK